MFDSNNPQAIKQLSDELVKAIYDPEMMESYGTSNAQGMTRDYSKKILNKLTTLQKEFKQIDKNQNDLISLDEFLAFFQERNPNITRREFEEIFQLFDKNKNQQISINEFVYSYVLLEEKLLLKKTKLKNLKEDLRESLKYYKKKRQNYANEIFNEYGISTQSELEVIVLEAKNLVSFSQMNLINSKVQLSLLQNKAVVNQKISNLQPKTNNPIFNENFLFPIENPDSSIKIEVIDQGTITGDYMIGSVEIPLARMNDQLKHDEVFQLYKDGDFSREKGSIQLVTRYRYNWGKYYDDLIAKTNTQIDRLNSTLEEMEEYENCFQQPFGIIVAQKVSDIVNKKIFEKSENVDDYRNTMRSSVYVPIKKKSFQNDSFDDNKKKTLSKPQSGISDQNLLSVIKEESVASGIIDGIKHKNKILFTSLIGLGISLMNFGWRNDFINLLVLSLCFLFAFGEKVGLQLKKIIIISSFASELIDCLWLFISFGVWNEGIYKKSNKSMICSYFLSVILFVVKGVLSYYLVPSLQ